MEELPYTLFDVVPNADRASVQRWWVELSEADRREVAGLCDARSDECFFGPEAGDDTPPRVLGGQFLAGDDSWRLADWEADWREYLTDHPELVIAARFQSRCLLTVGGQVCVWVDWSRTGFAVSDLPPSEQRHVVPGTSLGDCGR